MMIPLRNTSVSSCPAFVLAGTLTVLVGLFSFVAQTVDASQSVTVTDEAGVPQELTATETAWGTFKVGSWIRTRTTTITFQEKIAQNIAESTTTLEAVEPDGILLKQVASVEIGGQTVQGEPQLKKIDFYQQSPAGHGTVQTLPPEEIPIGNRTFLCGVRVYEQTTSQSRRRTKVWFNPKVAPYVLRVETTRTSLPTPEQPTEKPLGYSTSVVLNPPRTTLRGSLFGTYKIQTMRQHADGTVISLTNCSLQVPGWVESERTWEYDREKKLIRIQTTVSSGVTTNEEIENRK